MAIDGNAGFWRRDFKELIPVILDLIIESWKTFTPPIKPKIDEDRITRKFCPHLKVHKDRSIHLFKIWSQLELLSREGRLTGKPDLIFSPFNNDEEQYFAFECKLLNKKDKRGVWSSLSGKYIDDGLMRYISGQYSGGNNGGMIGYVVDGDTVKAIKCVNDAIEKRKEKLCINHKAQLRKSSIRPKCHQTKETEHLMKNGSFTVHHIFLPIMSCN